MRRTVEWAKRSPPGLFAAEMQENREAITRHVDAKTRAQNPHPISPSPCQPSLRPLRLCAEHLPFREERVSKGCANPFRCACRNQPSSRQDNTSPSKTLKGSTRGQGSCESGDAFAGGDSFIAVFCATRTFLIFRSNRLEMHNNFSNCITMHHNASVLPDREARFY